MVPRGNSTLLVACHSYHVNGAYSCNNLEVMLCSILEVFAYKNKEAAKDSETYDEETKEELLAMFYLYKSKDNVSSAQIINTSLYTFNQ